MLRVDPERRHSTKLMALSLSKVFLYPALKGGASAVSSAERLGAAEWVKPVEYPKFKMSRIMIDPGVLYEFIKGAGQKIFHMDKKLCDQLSVYKCIHERIVLANQV